MNRVAVLMSTYNGESFLKKQIDSILNQKGDFEVKLFVRDDGSTDSTCSILTEYSNNGKLEWYSGANLQPAKSFMDLLQKVGSSYDYYAFADQDDYWKKEKIHRAIASIENLNQPALYCSDALLVDTDLKSLGRTVYDGYTPRTDFYTLVCAGGLMGCTMLFNNALYKCIKFDNSNLNIMMHDFYIAVLCSMVGGKITYDNYPSMLYRQHGNNVVGVANGNKISILFSRFQEIFSKNSVTIAEQSQYILSRYGDSIEYTKRNWLRLVSAYRNNIFTRMKLCCSQKTRYININMSVKNRLSILLGNR